MDNASVWRARGPEIESHHGQEFFILDSRFFRVPHCATMQLQMKSTVAFT